MKRGIPLKQGMPFATIAAALVVLSLVTPVVQARTCSGNGDVIGSYGFTGSRSGFFLVGATAPGTTVGIGAGPLIPVAVTPPGSTVAPTVSGSNTPIGNLATGLSSRNAFAFTGRLFADGSGNIYAAQTAGSLVANTLAGKYTVSSDCAITMTIGDPFVSTTASTPPVLITGPAVTLSVVNSVTLEGVVINTGNAQEIDLVSTGATAGAVVTLSRTAQSSSCTNASVTGTYGISGQGLFSTAAGTGLATGTGTTGGTTGTGGTTVTPTTGAFTPGVSGPVGTPFNVLGRAVADGSGNFVTDSLSTTSAVKRAITGTYVVNADCTGTARLIDSAGVGRNVAFVLVNEAPGCLAGNAASKQDSLDFVFTDPGVIGSGTAKQQ